MTYLQFKRILMPPSDGFKMTISLINTIHSNHKHLPFDCYFKSDYTIFNE